MTCIFLHVLRKSEWQRTDFCVIWPPWKNVVFEWSSSVVYRITTSTVVIKWNTFFGGGGFFFPMQALHHTRSWSQPTGHLASRQRNLVSHEDTRNSCGSLAKPSHCVPMRDKEASKRRTMQRENANQPRNVDGCGMTGYITTSLCNPEPCSLSLELSHSF